jgi:hypothetical protein
MNSLALYLVSHHLEQDLIIFHQNIRGINNKTGEIVNTIVTNPPHVLRFTEHHLKTYQLDNILFKIISLMLNFVGKYTEMVGPAYLFRIPSTV